MTREVDSHSDPYKQSIALLGFGRSYAFPKNFLPTPCWRAGGNNIGKSKVSSDSLSLDGQKLFRWRKVI